MIATTVGSNLPAETHSQSCWTSAAAHSADKGAQRHGAPIGTAMDGFHSCHSHRGTAWLARAAAFGKAKCKSMSSLLMFVRSVKESQRLDVAHASFMQMVRRSVVLLNRWWRRVEGRNRLSIMSERELRDIGLSRQDADREIRKPFWRE